MKRTAFVLCLALLSLPLAAEIRRDPQGLNVNSQGATSLSITFGGLNNQVPVEAQWCGELIPATPAIGMRCDPRTVFGSLPLRFDLGKQQGSTFVDVMTIPPSVSRRAYQAVEAGAAPQFFYVRQFRSTTGGPDEFVFVTCRLTGGGARVPFALLDVTLRFESGDPVASIPVGGSLPAFKAEIAYNGVGTLRGRWEVVLPGEEPPTSTDLLTEGSLPPDQRSLQKRYREVGRFNVPLTAGPAKTTLQGPDPKLLPKESEGLHQILLRVEVSRDRDSASDLAGAGAGAGLVYSGAAAGFPMPTLRYSVGGGATPGAAFDLLAPKAGALVTGAVDFSWTEDRQALLYKLEIVDPSGTEILSALLQQGTFNYRAPSFLREKATSGVVRWRVKVLDAEGREKRHTEWRELKLKADA
ncbi:MAG: hypothetical protein JNK60_14410 [Acidobacteria bacterium]|nr:hypothetical protein [Acidobacteriota bacterium]